MVGIKARVVLRDIWSLDEDEAELVTLWITSTLARATAKRKAKP